MSMHGALAFAELLGVGFLTLAVVLLALLGTAAALHSGRVHQPAPVRVPGPIDRAEAELFTRYARGVIDAEEYHRALDRLAGELR